MSEDMVNVSVANLIAEIQRGAHVQSFAIRHPTDPSKPLQALSAGPKFPEKVRELLGLTFGADPSGFSGDDARCRIPASKVDEFIRWVEADFYLPHRDWSPCAELAERLTQPYWNDVSPILKPADLKRVSVVELGLFRQPPPDDEAERGGRGAKVRLFRKWCLIVEDEEVASRLIRSTVIFPLTESDLATTRGGHCIGMAGGYQLANNLGVKHWQPQGS